MNTIEPEVLEQVQKGDHQAFSQLVEVYQRPVYNLCYRMLGDANEAEDAAQETFMRVYKNVKHYDHQRPFSTWILSIAAHYCIDQLRKRRMVFISMDENPYLDPPDVSPGPESTYRMLEERKMMENLLKTLNPQDRAAIIMYYWYDFSYEEIATSLTLTVSAVKSRLHRARLSLAETWRKSVPARLPAERKANESPAF